MNGQPENVESISDTELVERAAFQSMTGHHAERVHAHRAAAELTRRLIVQISNLRDEMKTSDTTMKRLTWALVILTIVLVALAIVLIVTAS